MVYLITVLWTLAFVISCYPKPNEITGPLVVISLCHWIFGKHLFKHLGLNVDAKHDS